LTGVWGLKSKGRAKWRLFHAENYGHPCNRDNAAWLLLESWDELSDSVLTAAWDFNEDESDSDSDDSDDEFELRVDTDREDLNDKVDPDEEEGANEKDHEELEHE
jgi:hypothetical protein